jgi:iron complex transport system substrate-binding protein
MDAMQARLQVIRSGGSCRAGPVCFLKNGTSPTSAPSAGCPSWWHCRGDDCFPELATLQPMGKDRIIADTAEIVRRNPDIIIGSWCGKKFRPEKVAARAGWETSTL